ncbi:MAG TPA: A/G-specific adenine glycosylase [Longimicrobiales bacterium]
MSADVPPTPAAGAPDDGEIAAVRERLLAFYDARRRDLPWRADTDPYRVWVSEVMLQQTRVDAAIPYYERWMQRFPTLTALADADIDEVLRHWQGLGYYARARNLHRAARVLRERHHGRIPADPDALRRLPGIGDYTAGAIASIAFGIPAAAVDGNVRRVLCRLYDLPDPTPAELRRRAAALVPDERPGDFNQALMELGATLCTPRTPRCDDCPVATWCRARARGTTHQRPATGPARTVPEHDVGTAVVRTPAGRLLLRRRPEEGMLGGLWEFPGAEPRDGETPAAAAARAARSCAVRDPIPDGALGSITHTFTHRRITYHAYRFRVDAEPAAMVESRRRARPRGTPAGEDDAVAWVELAGLDAYALPAAQRGIVGMLEG